MEDRFKEMSDYFFVDYNNHFEKTYTFFSIEKKYDDFDWKSFINKIRTYTYGCKSQDFQKALQVANIFFTSGATIKQGRFDDYMSVDFNKNHYRILEHSNIGNY